MKISANTKPASRFSWIAIFKITARLVAGIGIGYAGCAAIVAFLTLALVGLGMERSEAVVLTSTIGFVLYTAQLVWAFSVASIARLWAYSLAVTGIFLAAYFFLSKMH